MMFFVLLSRCHQVYSQTTAFFLLVITHQDQKKGVNRKEIKVNNVIEWIQDYWDQFIWNHLFETIDLRPCSFDTPHGIWDHIHLRPRSSENTLIETICIWDRIHIKFFIWDHIDFTTTLIETTLIEAVLIYCESDFYNLPSTSLRETWRFARWLFIWRFATLPPFVSRGDSRWVVKMHSHFKTPQKPEKSSYLVFWGERCTSEMSLFWTKSKNYMFCVPARFLYRGAAIVSVFNFFNLKMKDEKRKISFCVVRNQSQEKIKYRGFEKRNVTAYGQNVWRVIFRNAIVLADLSIPKKISHIWNSTLLLGQIMWTCFSPEFCRKKDDAGTSSFLLNMLQDDGHLKIFSEFCYSSELTSFCKGATLQNFEWRVTLQNFRSPAKKWKVDHKNVIQ